MDLPGQLHSALGSAYRFEHMLGGGCVASVWRAHDRRQEWSG